MTRLSLRDEQPGAKFNIATATQEVFRQPASFLWLSLLCLVMYASPGYGQEVQFPELTGRVVDRADMLDAATEREITELLAAHERATSNQIVVATLENLQGRPIEEFGYQLGRAWGIGQKGKDNGALLLVGEAERAVRIEVGYGLEGQLTDAISSNIIHSIILPNFKQGQFAAGIEQGVTAMLQAVGGEYEPREPAAKGEGAGIKALVLLLVFGGWLALAAFTSTGGRGSGRGGLLLLLGASALSGGRGGFGGGGGGGFSGGGGGFGGGGASGGW